jgi:death-on-curing protein
VNVEWIAYETVLIFHEAQISEHGGAAGLRDEGGLRSALARQKKTVAYGEPDLCDLAAAYARGITQNHPFVDGNKRTAFVVSVAFLDLNGQKLTAPEADAALVFLRLAAGDFLEAELAEWFRRNSNPPVDAFLSPEQDNNAQGHGLRPAPLPP